MPVMHGRSLWAHGTLPAVRLPQRARAQLRHALQHRSRGVAHLVLHGDVLVQGVVAVDDAG